MVAELLKGLNVYLVGMMGVGKTTVGRLLAVRLGYGYFDTDAGIEQIAGKTITEIFAERGEESFRQLETQVLAEISTYTRLIVATGGGIVLRRFNWSYLHHGLVIWLDAPVEVLLNRLKEDATRPLLQTENPASTLQALLDQRRSLYSEADLHIQLNASQTPQQIVDTIVDQIPSVIKSSHP